MFQPRRLGGRAVRTLGARGFERSWGSGHRAYDSDDEMSQAPTPSRGVTPEYQAPSPRAQPTRTWQWPVQPVPVEPIQEEPPEPRPRSPDALPEQLRIEPSPRPHIEPRAPSEADSDASSERGVDHALQRIHRLIHRRKFPYDAMQSHGLFGLTLVDRTLAGACVLLLHVPRCNKRYFIDVKMGDQLQTITSGMEHMYLDVLFVTPDRYYAPGRRVTTMLLGVPDGQWRVPSRAGV